MRALAPLLAGLALLAGCVVAEPPAPTVAEVEQDLVLGEAAGVVPEPDEAEDPDAEPSIEFLPVEVEGLRLPGAEQQRLGGPQGGPEPDPWRGAGDRPEGGPEPDPWNPWDVSAHQTTGSGKKD